MIDEHEFERLYKQWNSETHFLSDMGKILENENYLKIKAMGKDVLYMVFRKMKKEPGHWFDLLEELTGENPETWPGVVWPPGDVYQMNRIWLNWAFNNGYADEFGTQFKPGYHLSTITRGRYGETSKIREELDELQDAEDQGSKILMMVELSDLYGAMEGFAKKLGITMDDVKQMSEITTRAFVNGKRKPKEDM